MVPGEEDVIGVLLDRNTTPEQIRDLCKEAVMTRTFMGREIEVLAGLFRLEARCQIVFRNTRSSLLQLCGMLVFQGAMYLPAHPLALSNSGFCHVLWRERLYGVSTRTAINLVGSLRPEETARTIALWQT